MFKSVILSQFRIALEFYASTLISDCCYMSNMNEHFLNFPDRKLKDAKGAFNASVDSGITFFDTAEVYGAGVGIMIVLALLLIL